MMKYIVSQEKNSCFKRLAVGCLPAAIPLEMSVGFTPDPQDPLERVKWLKLC